ncbi:MAG: FlgD Ig-like domain [Solirubrobacteraceae bacterium]|jgi:hypothetical protein|nr:FlgD Ig-like domain [Solirubrobacteraceae bacterium]
MAGRAHRVRRAGALALAIAVGSAAGAAPSAGAQAPAGHAVATGLSLPGDLAWGTDGRLYTTDHLTAAVCIVNIGTAAAPATPTIVTGGLSSPGAIAFDQGGNLWVADDATQGGGTLLRVPADAGGNVLPAQAAPVTQFTDAAGRSLRPDALAVDNLGNLYVGMARNGEIARVTTVGPPTVRREFAHTSTDRGATGLAWDGLGRLLVSEGADITAVDLAPGPSPKLTVPFLTSPLGAIGLVAPTDLVVTPDSLLILDARRVVRVPMAGGAPQPASAAVRMALRGTAGGLVADQVDRPHPPLGDLSTPALLAGDDPGSGAGATGTVVVSDAPLGLPGLTVPPPLAAATFLPPNAAAARPLRRAVLAIQVLPRGTRAPAFPRLRRSGHRFHPGDGRIVSVTFGLRRSARVTFTVRDRSGALVRRIRAGGRARGTVLRLNWDGRNRRGRLVRAGLYRFTVTAHARGSHRAAGGAVRVVRRS